ncbi:MAG: hypothetical protein ACREYE_30970 [Gammaproteobacteria bacterium]
MSETLAITGKSVKLFKGHYTSLAVANQWRSCQTARWPGGIGMRPTRRCLSMKS